MSECKHTVYKDGRIVLTETMPDKGLSYEAGNPAFTKPDEQEKRKKDIWQYRRELGDSYCH